jgi:sec-independent protein translocase protein TatB
VFDIGFSEMMVIAVVALVIIGPERLPKVARTLGHLTGRMQRYVNDVKADINREIELDELRKFKQEFETTAQTFESSVKSELQSTEDALNEAARSVTGEPARPPLDPATILPPTDPVSGAPAGDAHAAPMPTAAPGPITSAPGEPASPARTNI